MVGFCCISLGSLKTCHIEVFNLKAKCGRMRTDICSSPSQEFDIDWPYAITKNVHVFHIVGYVGKVVKAIPKTRRPQSHVPPVGANMAEIHWGNIDIGLCAVYRFVRKT